MAQPDRQCSVAAVASDAADPPCAPGACAWAECADAATCACGAGAQQDFSCEGDDIEEHVAHARELGDAFVEIAQSPLRQRLDAFASALPTAEPQQLRDLVERETEGLGAADELQAADVVGPVAAIARAGALRLGHQPGTLVEAHRVDAHVCRGGESSDGESIHGRPRLKPGL
nr:hypothetical protein [Panacagrimonas sp.]